MTAFSFDWAGYAKFYQEKFGCTPVPVMVDTEKPWPGWQKLKGLKISDKTLARWVSHKDFGGFMGLFSWYKIPLLLPPTVKQLYEEINPFIFAFGKVNLNGKVDWELFAKDMYAMKEKYDKTHRTK